VGDPHWYRGPIILPDRVIPDGLIEVRGQIIEGLWADGLPDHDLAQTTMVPEGGYLSPGFIDLHVHGGGGGDFMDGTMEAAVAITQIHAQHGTTGLFATMMTASEMAIIKGVRAVRAAPRKGAAILGLHFEGPFINKKMKGAQDESYVRQATLTEIDRWLDELGTDYRCHVTLAPEMAGAHEAIQYLLRRGVVVSAGHTDCTYEELQAAVAIGVSHATHLFNAMRPLHHREPGTVGAALTLPGMSVELIADGIHVHPQAMALAISARGLDRVILVTDAMRAAGMPDGEYVMGGQITTVKNGQVRLAGGALAGSILTMAGAVRNLVQMVGVSLPAAVAMASLNPARLHRLDDLRGSIAPGKLADILVLSRELDVVQTVVAGKLVYKAE